MRYPTREAFIANTDKAWFDFLRSRSERGRVDEVNFWLPKATRPMKRMTPGEPVFFRLKQPDYAIAGFGFFAAFHVMPIADAWTVFDWKNGDPDEMRFRRRIGKFRGVDLTLPDAGSEPMGCTVLRDATFWPETRWRPWGGEQGWAPNIVQGKTENEPARVARLMAELQADERAFPEELIGRFTPLDVDARRIVEARTIRREGQGAFRLRLLEAYEGRCAITGEHTEPVLDAAHIQPYLGPGSNHLQNGLLLTKEFHTLFDRGYVTVTPELEVRVSSRLRREWNNGKRYYAYDGKPLVQVPPEEADRPSPAALEWHARKVFLQAG